MKRIAWVLALAAAAALAAPSLFQSATESTWSVTSGGKSVATVTLLTDGANVRAEWKAAGTPAVFIGTNGKLWLKQAGGDVELGSAPASTEKQDAPALLLPYLTDAKAKTTLAAGKVGSYAFGTSTAAYTWDAKGPATIEVKSGATSWTLTRKTVGKPAATPA
ncbi:MAG TPA: hypothetical protein VGF40_01055, partial [Thermoanaerobaculia bacterium]